MIHIQDNPDKAVEEMLDELDFSWCIGGDILMQPERCIPLDRAIRIISNYIPQVHNYFNKYKEDK